MTDLVLPLWAELLVSLLLVCGSLTALIGSLGLLRLKDFYARIHSPTLGATLGCACLVAATILFFSLAEGRLAARAILISIFVVITAPLSAMLLIKVGMYRARRAEQIHEDEASGEKDLP